MRSPGVTHAAFALLVLCSVGCGGRERTEGSADAGMDASSEGDGGCGRRLGCPCENPGVLGCDDGTPMRCDGTTWVEDPMGIGCSSLCEVITNADGCPCSDEGAVTCSPVSSGGTVCSGGMWTQVDTHPACNPDAGTTDAAVGDGGAPADAMPDGSVPGAEHVGDACDSHDDCGGGHCADLPAIDASCTSGACTVVCPSWVVDDESFCASFTGEPGDCSDLGGMLDGMTVCTFESWTTTFCGG